MKILKNCRKVIPSKEEGGRVIIIDMVLDPNSKNEKFKKTQMLVDVVEMLYFNGGEREEKEWVKIFLEAGFSDYEVDITMGVRSVIVVYQCYCSVSMTYICSMTKRVCMPAGRALGVEHTLWLNFSLDLYMLRLKFIENLIQNL